MEHRPNFEKRYKLNFEEYGSTGGIREIDIRDVLTFSVQVPNLELEMMWGEKETIVFPSWRTCEVSVWKLREMITDYINPIRKRGGRGDVFYFKIPSCRGIRYIHFGDYSYCETDGDDLLLIYRDGTMERFPFLTWDDLVYARMELNLELSNYNRRNGQ